VILTVIGLEFLFGLFLLTEFAIEFVFEFVTEFVT
jgi:hypothetical protein